MFVECCSKLEIPLNGAEVKLLQLLPSCIPEVVACPSLSSPPVKIGDGRVLRKSGGDVNWWWGGWCQRISSTSFSHLNAAAFPSFSLQYVVVELSPLSFSS